LEEPDKYLIELDDKTVEEIKPYYKQRSLGNRSPEHVVMIPKGFIGLLETPIYKEKLDQLEAFVGAVSKLREDGKNDHLESRITAFMDVVTKI